jgi:cold shock CspA family protein
MMTGEIISYDAADGLGVVRLEDGREVRFTLTACGYMRPEVGKKVRVLSLTEGFEGRPKATMLEPEGE